MKLQKAPPMGLHFPQKYLYAGTGEQAWFADLDPKCQLRDKTGSEEGAAKTPRYRALLVSVIVKPVVNKVRVLRYRLKRLTSYFHFSNPNTTDKSAKPEHVPGIRWAETELEFQEREARARHGTREYTVYQISQTRIRFEKLRKKYLQKRRRRQVSVAERWLEAASHGL